MEYNETLAKKLKEKYKLSGSTYRTWKLKNHIPDHYADENYVPPKPATPRQLEHFSTLSQLPYLYWTRVGSRLPKHRYADFRKGKGNARIRKYEMNQVAFDIRKLKQYILVALEHGEKLDFQKIFDLKFVNKRAFINHETIYLLFKKGNNKALAAEEKAHLISRCKTILEELPFVHKTKD